jgi:hypothetical protein
MAAGMGSHGDGTGTCGRGCRGTAGKGTRLWSAMAAEAHMAGHGVLAVGARGSGHARGRRGVRLRPAGSTVRLKAASETWSAQRLPRGRGSGGGTLVAGRGPAGVGMTTRCMQ